MSQYIRNLLLNIGQWGFCKGVNYDIIRIETKNPKEVRI